MAYRDQEEALRARLDVLEREKKRLVTERSEVEASLEIARRDRKELRQRMQEAGTGAGPRDARRDRIDLAALLLCMLGLATLFFHFEWHRYITRDATVLPAIAWLATPGILAVLVAWPYRELSTRCRVAVSVGALVASFPLINFSIAWLT